MKIIIVGSGKTIYFLCRNFTAKGHDVSIISNNKDECVQFAKELKATIVYGDGSNPDLLQEIGIMSTDTVLAITPSDSDNLVICQIATLQFGVPKAIALANDPDNVAVFKDLGVSAFSTADIIGSLIEQKASLDQIINLLPVGEGKVNITEIVIDKNASIKDKLLKDIKLPENALIGVIIRNGNAIVPRGMNVLTEGDRVILITLPENHGAVLKIFTGE